MRNRPGGNEKSLFDRVFGADPFRTEYSSKWKLTYPLDDEPPNDPVEYKVIHQDTLTDGQQSLEEGLNKLGAAGWELKDVSGSRLIFMRFTEDADETEESGPDDV